MKTAGLSIGVALGSGVARGWAHIGVLRRLVELGIKPDIVCGTSIGALVGGVYLAGWLDPLEVWARDLNKLRLTRLLDLQLGHGGLIAGRRIMELFNEELRNLQIESLPARFACICTDLFNGHEVWLQTGNMLDAIRASYALPGLFPPVRIDGRWLFDGALVNPVPVSVCRALGAHIVLAVNLNADVFGASGPKSAAELASEKTPPARHGRGLPGADLVRHLFRQQMDEPSIFAVMERSLNIVQDRISRSRLAGDPADVTIAPKLGDIGLLQFDRASDSIRAGEEAVDLMLPAIEEALLRYRADG
jgi:NTE family protein